VPKVKLVEDTAALGCSGSRDIRQAALADAGGLSGRLVSFEVRVALAAYKNTIPPLDSHLIRTRLLLLACRRPVLAARVAANERQAASLRRSASVSGRRHGALLAAATARLARAKKARQPKGRPAAACAAAALARPDWGGRAPSPKLLAAFGHLYPFAPSD
jgi:hypothetical protein